MYDLSLVSYNPMCVVLCCVVLCCVVLCCVVLCCVVLCCVVLCCVVLYCIVLCSVLFCSMLSPPSQHHRHIPLTQCPLQFNCTIFTIGKINLRFSYSPDIINNAPSAHTHTTHSSTDGVRTLASYVLTVIDDPKASRLIFIL